MTLAGLDVLVVEDEGLVAMVLAELLGDAGAVVRGPAASVDEAMGLLALGWPDAAVLDVNLAGERSTPVAEALLRRGVPFVVATGYGRDGLPACFDAVTVLAKPYGTEELLDALGQAVAAARR